mmetsp:Transcript_12094/g.35038  ORF Transcript_12094/g.35038 Transcript_12094/m.35038 type:complete len:317 (-) Transcript_12094:1317-2267(-)
MANNIVRELVMPMRKVFEQSTAGDDVQQMRQLLGGFDGAIDILVAVVGPAERRHNLVVQCIHLEVGHTSTCSRCQGQSHLLRHVLNLFLKQHDDRVGDGVHEVLQLVTIPQPQFPLRGMVQELLVMKHAEKVQNEQRIALTLGVQDLAKLLDFGVVVVVLAFFDECDREKLLGFLMSQWRQFDAGATDSLFCDSFLHPEKGWWDVRALFSPGQGGMHAPIAADCVAMNTTKAADEEEILDRLVSGQRLEHAQGIQVGMLQVVDHQDDRVVLGYRREEVSNCKSQPVGALWHVRIKQEQLTAALMAVDVCCVDAIGS